MNLVSGLEGCSVLKEVVLRWLDECSAVYLDSAVCNCEIRPSILRVFESKIVLRQQYTRGNASFHRSVSKLLIGFQYQSKNFENNIVNPWCESKINWCVSRSISITSLHFEDIDLAEPMNVDLHSLNLENVVELEISERPLNYPEHHRHNCGTTVSEKAKRRRLSQQERCNALSAIINRFPKLISLSVDNTSAVTFDCFVKISNHILNQVHLLVVQLKCDSGSVSDLLNLFAKHCKNLLVLNIDDSLSYFRDELLQKAVSTALVQLVLNNNRVEDFSMHSNPIASFDLFRALSQHCLDLRYVKCTVLWDYTDVIHFAAIINACKKLLRLEITGISDCDILYCLRQGLMLKCINISGDIISSAHLISLFHGIHLPLTKIRIWGMKEFHPDVLIAIGENNPSLQLFLTVECEFSCVDLNEVQKILKEFCRQVKVDIINSNTGNGKYLSWASVYSEFAFTKASPKFKTKF
jgi:hypothetical protein